MSSFDLFHCGWFNTFHRREKNEKTTIKKSVRRLEKSKQFQLHRSRRRFNPFVSADGVCLGKLFVRDPDDGNQTLRRNHPLDSREMDVHRLVRRARPDVDGILHHGESVLEQILPEPGRFPALVFRENRKIEADEQPHGPVPAQRRVRHAHAGNSG